MAGIYKGLTIKLGADTTGLSDALNRIDSQTRGLKRNMSAVNKAFKLDPGNAELQRQKMEAYQKEIQNASKRLETLKQAESEIGKQGMSTEAWDTLQREIATTEAELRRLTEEYRNFVAANSTLGKAGAAVSELGSKLEPVGERMRSIGGALTIGVTAPIVAGATASVKAAVDIDSALTGVRKTVDATAEEYAALKEAAVEYSKVNAVSAVDVLNAEELGGQLGVAKDNLREFAEVTTGLSVSTNMGVEDASTNMARFMNVTQANADASKSAAEQYRAYGNVIVGLGNNLATTESEISNFSLRMASAGSLAGMSQADIMGLGGAMSSLGLEAEAGGTAFSNTITEISIAVSKGGDELAGFAEVAGMSAEAFAEKWNSDATGAFIDFINGLASGKEAGEDMNVVLENLGITGIRQSDAMRRLAGNTSLLTDAVKLANDQWRDGSALSDEVANRNESLASKFEMLRNRVLAVAEQVGAPLADAMLEAIDAAEPLFDAIESGARAFSEMDEGEQRAVMTTVALIAALGPALNLFGRAASGVKVLGGALTTLSRFLTNTTSRSAELALSIDKVRAAQARHVASLGTESAALKAHEAQLVAAQRAEERSAAAAKASSIAMGAAKAAAVGLAVAGIAVLVSEISKYVEHQGKVSQATDGLRDAVGKLDGPLSTQSGSLDSAAGSARNYRDEVDKLIESNAELAEKISETNTKTMADASVAQSWADKVKAAVDGFDGSADAQAALKAAVDGYNAATGSSIEITDAATGALSVSTAELQRNADAWIANARAQAAREMGEEAVRGQVEAEMALADAKDAVASAQEAYNQSLARGDNEQLVASYAQELQRAEAAEAEAREAVEARAEAVEKMDEQYQRYTKEAMLASQTTDDFRKALEAATEGAESFDGLAESIGKNADELAVSMSSAGITVQELASMGSNAFSLLYQRSGEDMEKVRRNLDMLNECGIDPKELHVSDDGSIRDSKDNVIDLDNQRINDKDFKVWAQTQQAESALERVRSKLAEIKNKEVQVKATAVAEGVTSLFGIKFAQGGISPLAAKRIPRHADGGIEGVVTRATLTTAGLVGEAGAEYIHDFGDGSAIVPIQNSRYVRPLAHEIAREMGGDGRQNVYDIDVTLDWRAGDDANAMAEELAYQLRRKVMMEGR